MNIGQTPPIRAPAASGAQVFELATSRPLLDNQAFGPPGRPTRTFHLRIPEDRGDYKFRLESVGAIVFAILRGQSNEWAEHPSSSMGPAGRATLGFDSIPAGGRRLVPEGAPIT